MTRKFLQGLGLETEVIDKVMAAHGEGIEREKGVAEDLRKEVKDAKEALKVALAASKTALEKAKEEGGEGWKEKYEAEAAAHEKTKGEYQAEKEGASIDAKVADLLKGAGMNEKAIDKALRLYDRATVEIDEAGGIKNGDKVLESFKKDWDGFFGVIETQKADVGDPPISDGKADPFIAGFKGE